MRTNLEDLIREADPAELYEMPPVTGDRDDPLYASILSRRGIDMVKETTDQIGNLESGTQRRQWTPVIAFAAAFVLVVAAIGLISLFRSESPPTADEQPMPVTTSIPATTLPETTLPAASAAPAPTTTTMSVAPVAAPVPDIEWVEVELDPDILDMDWIVATKYGLIGAGQRRDPSGEEYDLGALWRSTDGGTTWIDIEPGQFGQLDAEVVGPIGVSPDGTIVVFVSDVDDFGIWATTDLQSWTQVESPDFAGPNLQIVGSIAWGNAGFVAVGKDAMGAGVWVSPDGFEWARVQHDALLPEEWGAADMYDVTAGGPGYVAVGSVGFREGGPGGASTENAGEAIWVSENGYEWDLQIVDDPGDWGLGSVEADPTTGRLITFGGDRWYSNDGYEWEWVDRTVPLGGPPPGSRVAWYGDTAVAGFWDSAFSLWVSGDAGETWSRVDPDQTAFDWCGYVRGIIEVDGHFVAHGYRAGETGCNADLVRALWIGTPAP